VRDGSLMRVLGAVLRDIRGASPHQHSETGSLVRFFSYRVFVSFFGFLFERFLLPIPMELAPPVSGVVLYCILFCIIIIIIVLFILRFILFYSFSLSYACLVVRTWQD
jgi:hypothetical protein